MRNADCAMLSQAVQSVDREEMFAEHIKERERRKRAEEKAARKRKLREFKDLLERSSGIKVCLLPAEGMQARSIDHPHSWIQHPAGVNTSRASQIGPRA